jgi:PadR family transcriptional regulator, regulatory protein PadR
MYICIMNTENAKSQMKRGVLELCILSIIAENEVYPSDIIGKLKDSEMIVVEGTLYPLLTRLKNLGLLQYNWQESLSGPPRKYFSLTETGRESLDDLKSSWQELVTSVNQIIKTEKK